MSVDKYYEVTVHAFGMWMRTRMAARNPAEARDMARRVYDVRIEAKEIERSEADESEG